MPDSVAITVGIATRNRPQSLLRCIKSLALIGDLVTQIVVADDSSEVPAAHVLTTVDLATAAKLQVIRHEGSPGPIAGRNAIMKRAKNDYVLSLDDDAYLLEGAGIRRAVALMDGHPAIAAVACAQAEANGAPWPAGMQPAPVTYACTVPAFIGFAALIRRAAFHEVGGYREPMHYYGEEKDLCVRLWHAGYQVVYLPDVRVAHVPDPAGRSQARYVRYAIRNDCLFALYNEPLPLPFVSVPIRLARYFSMSRGQADPGGLGWIIRDLARQLPVVLGARRPVTWKSLRQWRRVQRTSPAFPVAATP